MFESKFLKVAKPVDIDRSIAKAIWEFVWKKVQSSIHSNQDPWEFRVHYGEMEWEFLLDRFLDSRFDTSLSLIFQIGNTPSDTPCVERANFYLHQNTQYIYIQTSMLSKEQALDPPGFLYRDLQDALSHELVHALQFQWQKVKNPTLKGLGVPEGEVNHNIETKALSLELCNDLRTLLEKNKDVNIPSFLGNSWKWKQLKPKLENKYQQQILKDLYWVQGQYQVHQAHSNSLRRARALQSFISAHPEM